jgi:adenylate cyclase
LIANLRRLPLRTFPEALEPDFRAYYQARSVPFVRAAALLAAAIYLVFLFWDLVVDPEVIPFSLRVRASVSLILVGHFACTFHPWFRRRIQLVSGTGCVTAGVGIVLIIDHIKGGLTLGLAGVLLPLMFNFGFVRLLFWPSVLSGLMIIAAYNVAALLSPLPVSLIVANNFFLVSAVIAGASITYLFEKLFRAEFLADRELARERVRGDLLIENMLPAHVAARLKAGETMIAESHPEATVLFADIVGFTELTKTLAPARVVELLNDIFTIIDGLTEKHGLDKIKTMGDSYMAAAGIATAAQDSAAAVAAFALDMVEGVSAYGRQHRYPLTLRVGIHTGEVVSGVIGLKKFSYDLWGETVNLASRLESQSGAGQIQVSEATYQRLRGRYRFTPRGLVKLRGIGEIPAYFLVERNVPLGNRRLTG